MKFKNPTLAKKLSLLAFVRLHSQIPDPVFQIVKSNLIINLIISILANTNFYQSRIFDLKQRMRCTANNSCI